MLGLKLPTDTRWAQLAKSDLQELLTDHAWCEQKAASNAIHLVVHNPDKPDLVDAMLDLAKEELEHFRLVHEKIKARGWALGPERKDDYVNRLYQFMLKGHHDKKVALADRLLFAAMVEARSCERFKLLHQTVDDEELKSFYFDLMASEAGHYTLFLEFARKYGPDKECVNRRWAEWLEFEAALITEFGKKQTMHG
ncbi:MAG: tRNA-(ms[2]io[6]A)-hydroxylase [Bacteroidia bacterium]|nr:tRNA-(ms[2]io[6]A)-hydroxylase [Bacteroidia bacterium]